MKFQKPDPNRAAEVAKAFDDFGRRTQAAGKAITRFGLNLMAAGLLLGLGLLLVYWVL